MPTARDKGAVVPLPYTELGASHQMSLTQAIAYWKGQAEMAERRNLDGELEADTEIAALKDQLQRRQAVIEAARGVAAWRHVLWVHTVESQHAMRALDAALATLTQEEPDD